MTTALRFHQGYAPANSLLRKSHIRQLVDERLRVATFICNGCVANWKLSHTTKNSGHSMGHGNILECRAFPVAIRGLDYARHDSFKQQWTNQDYRERNRTRHAFAAHAKVV